MLEIDYSGKEYTIRSDFAQAHNRYWKRLASPGAWFSGAERIAIAKEVRQASSCSLCSQRKAAISPNQIAGVHDSAGGLSDPIVEVIHRVVTDSGRLTKTWFNGIIQQGLAVENYVEIIGTIVNVFSIDEFCRGMGIPLNELPEAQSGGRRRCMGAHVPQHSRFWSGVRPLEGAYRLCYSSTVAGA
jgi:hypothetical protein